ncbi:MAG: GxxExxY protein [Patescibacteria group bacterium]|nr:GxxExxY protein [Patescibacteria group bacterium]
MYQNTKTKNIREDLVEKDLCYKIVGVLMEVYKQLGSGHREQYYQRAIAAELTRQKYSFKQFVRTTLNYKDAPIGVYILDFLIEGRVVLEIKKDNYFSRQHIDQVNGYLKTLDLRLGILANFTKEGVKFKRIVNLY